MEYTISGQELERLRKTCKLRLTISVVLAVAVYLAVLGFTVWAFFPGDPEMGARLDDPLSEKLMTTLGGPIVIAVLAWALFYWLIVKPEYDRFNNLFKNKYVISTIQEIGVFQDLSYQPRGGLTHDEIRNAAVVACGDKRRFESEDMLSGCYQGLRFRYCDVSTAHMPLADKFPFRLRHIGEQLQDNVCDQRSGQVSPLAGIQQRHIQNNNGCLLLLGDNAPLLHDFLIIAPQPVDALDDKGVGRL